MGVRRQIGDESNERKRIRRAQRNRLERERAEEELRTWKRGALPYEDEEGAEPWQNR